MMEVFGVVVNALIAALGLLQVEVGIFVQDRMVGSKQVVQSACECVERRGGASGGVSHCSQSIQSTATTQQVDPPSNKFARLG
jgi:hypothetical protein